MPALRTPPVAEDHLEVYDRETTDQPSILVAADPRMLRELFRSRFVRRAPPERLARHIFVRLKIVRPNRPNLHSIPRSVFRHLSSVIRHPSIVHLTSSLLREIISTD